jgi:hypothetical protein
VVVVVTCPGLVDGGALEVLGDSIGCGAVAFGFEPCESVVPLPVPVPVPLPVLLVPLPAGEGEAVLTARAD